MKRLSTLLAALLVGVWIAGGIRTSAQDLTTMLTVTGASLTSDTFLVDSQVYFATGLTESSGYIIDWSPATGGTSGTLRLSGVQGSILVGQQVEYVTLGASGSTVGVNATVTSISHRSDMKYASGEVLYIQNINPITRNLEQREEIKLVIEL